MLACPSCRSRLSRTATPKGLMFVCRRCGGRSVGIAVLRRQAEAGFMKKLRLAAYSGGQHRGRPCPHCARPMAEVQPDPIHGSPTLDVCTRCHVVWFDPREFSAVPAAPEGAGSGHGWPEPRPPVLPVARAAVEVTTPDSAWKYIPGILGWPVELEAMPPARKPVVTWGLSALMAAVFAWLVSAGSLPATLAAWGFIPDQLARHSGLTLLTSFFLHAGVLHLVSNLYFLVIFGDNVEDHLGPGWFLVLLAGAHLAGMTLHAALTGRANVPCVGASAGISGVIAYYAIAFPHARIGFFIWFFLRWLNIGAIWALVLYALVQLLGAWQQVAGFGSVSYLGHLGGLAVGIVVGLIVRARSSNPPA